MLRVERFAHPSHRGLWAVVMVGYVVAGMRNHHMVSPYFLSCESEMACAESAYHRALCYYYHGSYVEAVDVLQLHLEHHPDDPSAWELKGVLCHALCDFEPGKVALEHARTLQGLSVSGQLALADCYANVQQPQMAVAIYCRLAQLPIEDAEVLSRLARGLGMVQQYALAADVCQRACHVDLDSHNARYGVAYYMSKADYPAELIQPILVAAIAMAPQVFFYRVALVTVLSRLHQNEKAYLAIADATTQEIQSLKCTCCLQRLAQLYREAGDQHRAGLCCRRLGISL
ncbi:tetratricopeptide repeat protein [Bremerella alba]|uniref:Tetratricopeptide repeat protein n=1 Tax=Bremerella alba TaxID=980252 RepID=A0A7V9A6V1_9BACT|nr:hypothetical protein [Bremerella alba]MBA2114668.1 hypothetical protein [Bremerella alba]